MTVTCGRTGFVQQNLHSINRDVVLKLWEDFYSYIWTTDKEGDEPFRRHEHPTLSFAMIRFHQRKALKSYITNARFVGRGWEITFTIRDYPDARCESIDWNVGLWLDPADNDFEYDWTLGILAAK